jgi:hypothetical protein
VALAAFCGLKHVKMVIDISALHIKLQIIQAVYG